MSSEPDKRRWRWLIPALALLLLAALVFWWRAGPVAHSRPTVESASSSAHGFFDALAVRLPPPGNAPIASRAQQRKQILDTLQLATDTYCGYRQATRYPPGSANAGEAPDLMFPGQSVLDQHPLQLDGGGSDARVQIQTSQSRIYLAAGETAVLSLRALDADGAVLPLTIQRALAEGLRFQGQRPAPQVALAFADDGKGADAVADDGAWSAAFAPAQTALAGFNGTIRVELRFHAGGKNGVVFFDLQYSPEVPAVWNGPARETLDNGSLVYVLKAEVRQAGRYIVTGRVDDARGVPLALATFNDVLATGPAEVRLTVFGKLLRDRAPAMPLTLRDVEGYLLKENSDPDRALMPRLDGRVVTGKAYSGRSFSDAEWAGEERSRYLAEFGRDLQAARAAAMAVDPSLVLPADPCADTP
ncbi:MAG: choice-of-anchor X domain-containing protein [Gammaproteobacteria bacterium]